jgi:ligand-binding SRPBCC domain-containing protein
MTMIHLETRIAAPIHLCFDLSRSVDVHSTSMATIRERVIAGRMTGLLELDETVTWQAYPLGIRQQLTSKITAMEKPYRFVDEMVEGFFKHMRHEHLFEQKDSDVMMVDQFCYTPPLGWIGNLFDWLFLKRLMTALLTKRNQAIKKIAEEESFIASG